jgi:hypothetical protein
LQYSKAHFDVRLCRSGEVNTLIDPFPEALFPFVTSLLLTIEVVISNIPIIKKILVFMISPFYFVDIRDIQLWCQSSIDNVNN